MINNPNLINNMPAIDILKQLEEQTDFKISLVFLLGGIIHSIELFMPSMMKWIITPAEKLLRDRPKKNRISLGNFR